MKALIPGTDGFYATSDGCIYDTEGNLKTTYVNGDGYITAAVKVVGRWVTMGVHRLMALAFLSDSKTVERDQVNHIDGDVKNNDLVNLEWVTVRENNIHAALLSENVEKPKLVAISPIGEVSFIWTTEEACSLIGCTFKELWQSIKDGLLIDGWSIRYNDGPIPESLRKKVTPYLYEKVSVRILDTITKEVLEFPSLKAVADRFGTSASLVNQTMTTSDRIRIFMKKYIVVRQGDNFPEVSEERLEELRSRSAKPVLALNLRDKSMTIYQTATDFYTKNGLSKKAVTTLLRQDRIREVGGFVFLYLTANNSDRLKNYQPLSGATD